MLFLASLGHDRIARHDALRNWVPTAQGVCWSSLRSDRNCARGAAGQLNGALGRRATGQKPRTKNREQRLRILEPRSWGPRKAGISQHGPLITLKQKYVSVRGPLYQEEIWAAASPICSIPRDLV